MKQFEIERDGIEIREGLFSDSELGIFDKAAKEMEAYGSHRGGDRNVFAKHPEVLSVFRGASAVTAVEEILWKGPALSEALYLNKGSDANWLVAWHQDSSISVKRKLEAPGYSTWVEKDGKPYVQPPVEVLENCLWLRINLDDNDEGNGCLKVIPGSHRRGKLNSDEIAEWAAKGIEVSLPVKRGTAILFRPLLLHSSGKSRDGAKERRVIQGLFSGYGFTNGMEWPYQCL